MLSMYELLHGMYPVSVLGRSPLEDLCEPPPDDLCQALAPSGSGVCSACGSWPASSASQESMSVDFSFAVSVRSWVSIRRDNSNSRNSRRCCGPNGVKYSKSSKDRRLNTESIYDAESSSECSWADTVVGTRTSAVASTAGAIARAMILLGICSALRRRISHCCLPTLCVWRCHSAAWDSFMPSC